MSLYREPDPAVESPMDFSAQAVRCGFALKFLFQTTAPQGVTTIRM